MFLGAESAARTRTRVRRAAVVPRCVPRRARLRSCADPDVDGSRGRRRGRSLIAAAAAIDAIRFAVGTPMAGVANFVIVWLIPVVIGVAYARQLIGPRAALVVAAAAFAAQVVLAAVGPYEVSLVVTGTERISNVSPPTLLLALHCTWMSLRVRGRRGSDPTVGRAAPRLVRRRGGQRGSDDALPLAHPRDRGRHLRSARRSVLTRTTLTRQASGRSSRCARWYSRS